MKSEPNVDLREYVLHVLGLYRLAASFKGLEYRESGDPIHPEKHAVSKTIKEYALDDTTLDALSKLGFKKIVEEQYGMMSLMDQNPQDPRDYSEGFVPSNNWNFKRRAEGEDRSFDARINLHVDFSIDMARRGVVLHPQAMGTSVSPADRGPNLRMFRALTRMDPDAPKIAKEIAESNGSIMVTWSDLGLGGLRNLSRLFDEFVNGNETIRSMTKLNIFDPSPDLYQGRHRGDLIYITEPGQPLLFEEWKRQLKNVRARLGV